MPSRFRSKRGPRAVPFLDLMLGLGFQNLGELKQVGAAAFKNDPVSSPAQFRRRFPIFFRIHSSPVPHVLFSQRPLGVAVPSRSPGSSESGSSIDAPADGRRFVGRAGGGAWSARKNVAKPGVYSQSARGDDVECTHNLATALVPAP